MHILWGKFYYRYELKGLSWLQKKIGDVKIVPEPFRIGDEGCARTKKNSNNRAYSLATDFTADMS